MSSTSDRIDSIAMMCLDNGLALRALFIPVDALSNLLTENTAGYAYDQNHINTILGNWQWRTVAGPVDLLAQDLDYPKRLHIDGRGMVDCSLDSAPTLALLNRLLRLKIYDPSPV